MKIFLCLLALSLLYHTTRAQTLPPPLPGLPFDSLTHEPNYHGTVAVPGMSAAELHGRAREWVALTFQDAHQVTQLDDAARGVLIGRGYKRVLVNVNSLGRGEARLVSFTFRFDFREGRYRYELRDLGTRTGVGLLNGTSNDSNIRDATQLALGQYLLQTTGTATLASSPQQLLMGPGTTNNSDDYRSNGTLAKTWPQNSARINAALLELLDSLARHEKAPAARW
ncbi:DUF4468 domain-containing protein [Hymenobacter cheonanensis]|uniref:DUF4468 domain-containing protein n=1 Tax=Hymenobacter sp. CA2-7 TaxID=3063993 RepID=UPI002712AFB2|nr:DUF4468 domain-containing protein [Hymenobacter sp. CA2-7]MDO7884998.1 DUF4468 domain-containing protein [Hymenobacter sp. CA2-7]